MSEHTLRSPRPTAATPPRRGRSKGLPPWVVGTLKILGLAVVVVWCLFPFLWMAMTSLRTGADALIDPNILRGPFTLESYEQVVDLGFQYALRNSLIVASVTTLICIPVAALAGYALARLPLAGKFVILALTLVATLFPPVALVNPLYQVYLELDGLIGLSLLNSYAGMILPYVALTLPLAIFILTTFFAGIPKEIEESAKVDGATPFQAFWRVVAPLAAPGVGAAAILTFVYATNEFLLAFSFAPADLNVQTVPVFIGTFERVGYEDPIGQVMAASVLVSIPLILFALVLQRRIVAGLTSGAVKG
ncbi:carbohydrate ABC transporter permease [Nocardiopsis salina]|uniref:carbohydrate ABC transporter permease n=1 Tax=Nocardiopsis salina TaxID=245836 RepID=UPI00034B4843|nr:carbohydrate ABC transporter permease [Nocardiopsis salina]